MHPTSQELTTHLTQLRELYQKALHLGSEIPIQNEEQIEAMLDERFRILQRCTILSARAKELGEFIDTLTLPQSERAFLREQLSLVKDLAPKFAAQDRQMGQNLRIRATHLRNSMVSHNQQANAIHQYLSAPQAKPYV